MKKFFCLLFLLMAYVPFRTHAAPPDSAYLFAYSINEGTSGLLLAWSIDKEQWHGIGPEHRFLFSDFGRWGSQKRMFAPYLFKDNSGLWHCIWSLNEGVHQFAHASSNNLYDWGRQVYPEVIDKGTIEDLEVQQKGNEFIISWLVRESNVPKYYQTTTTDFKSFSATKPMDKAARLNVRTAIDMDGERYEGVIKKVSWELIDNLIKAYEWNQFHEQERSERIVDDAARYEGVEEVDMQVKLKPQKAKNISDMLMGIFFEDISYAADGGLYAELLQNRDFEYAMRDKGFNDPTWTSKKSWELQGQGISFSIDTVAPIHVNNQHYAVLDISSIGSGLVNTGWEGIPVKRGETYYFSLFAKAMEGTKNGVEVQLLDSADNILGSCKVGKIKQEWKKYEARIEVNKSYASARLHIIPQQTGELAIDMVSLFPKNTFKQRRNGLRADLANVIVDLKPQFVRFPGGCVAHGDGLDNIYRWKNSIGPLEARKPMRNIWGYHQSLGLGYYEYFQFCEDIGAEPVPVLAAGVPCQNSSTGGHGQCGGIPMAEMDEYVQDVLDLIEWANGDKSTKWGRVRAESGHPKPFHLKYLGIGNEDLITDIFEERFTMIYNAVKEKYPDIVVIGTVGPTYTGTDYKEGWALANKLHVPMVDEHYYQSPGWFINNQDFYDKYDRSASKVYLGEYAAHIPGRKMNIETALSEALYLTAVERNADVVHMTSFAPLLAKEKHTDWNPDLIYFNNTEVKPTVDYYVQQLFGQNSGDQYIPQQIELPEKRSDLKKRIGVSVVKDSATGDLIIKLANVLPVRISTDIDLADQKVGERATVTVLKGKPADDKAKPVSEDMAVSDHLTYQMPAYSFSVIRIFNSDRTK